jgi:tRNA (mo5U34)-methyltransferase
MSELAVRVAAQRWYHTLDLPAGVTTPGEYDLRAVSARLPWPALAGRRCLDVGSRDGFYAFEMERRGAAEVVALDLDDPDAIDFPGPRPPREAIQAELDVGNAAFTLAREALQSDVQRLHRSVYDLRAGEVGRFDFAVIGTLMLHLRDPLGALRALRGVTDRLLVNEAVVPALRSLGRRPWAELASADGPFWWLPTPAALQQMVAAGGFAVERCSRPYLVPWGPAGPQAGHVLGRPLRGIPRRALLSRGIPHAWVLAR